MAKARAIVKRRKAVRNIRKITKTMQMIATAKFQKSLKRAVGTKPYTLKVRELVARAGRQRRRGRAPAAAPARTDGDAHSNRDRAASCITSNRGLAGAYNGSVLRTADRVHPRSRRPPGKTVDLYVVGQEGRSATSTSRSGRSPQRVEAAGPAALRRGRRAAPSS